MGTNIYTGWGARTAQTNGKTGDQKSAPLCSSAIARTYGAAMHALKQQADLQPGETLVVLGADCPIGLAAVELGGLLGARVIAVCQTGEKCEMAWSAGAHDLINLNDTSLDNALAALIENKDSVVGFSAKQDDKNSAIAPYLTRQTAICVAAVMSPDTPPNKDHYAQMFKWYQQGLLLPQGGKTYAPEQTAPPPSPLKKRPNTESFTVYTKAKIT